MGLEPTATCVTGRYSNQLSYTPVNQGKRINALLRKNFNLNKIIKRIFWYNRNQNTGGRDDRHGSD
jgi:hypothetical protein